MQKIRSVTGLGNRPDDPRVEKTRAVALPQDHECAGDGESHPGGTVLDAHLKIDGERVRSDERALRNPRVESAAYDRRAGGPHRQRDAKRFSP